MSRWPQTWKMRDFRDFSEHGKLGESSENSVQHQGKIVFFVRVSNICLKRIFWKSNFVAATYLLEFYRVTLDEGHYYNYFFCCDNLWTS